MGKYNAEIKTLYNTNDNNINNIGSALLGDSNKDKVNTLKYNISKGLVKLYLCHIYKNANRQNKISIVSNYNFILNSKSSDFKIFAEFIPDNDNNSHYNKTFNDDSTKTYTNIHKFILNLKKPTPI